MKYFFPILLLGSLLWGCEVQRQPPDPLQIIQNWVDLTLHILKDTPANSPTFASRSLGYIGLTLYETLQLSDSNYQSISKQLDGLEMMIGRDSLMDYCWPVVLSAGQASILKSIYIQTSDKNKYKIDSLHQTVVSEYSKGNWSDIELLKSEKLGRKVAENIFEWSKGDGGHRAYLRNFDKNFVWPVFPGSWQPALFSQSFSHYPLHPNWGENRTFLKVNRNMEDPEMIPYSTDSTSSYYHQFKKVYEKGNTLTQDEKEAAIWWGDDPSETFNPPGHSYYLASIAIDSFQPEPLIAAQVYASLGMGLADAFIKCWEWKYRFFTERPNTYIPAHIDSSWISFWPDPPFPAFPSGHAIQASVFSHTIIYFFGDDFEFYDRAHEGRSRDEIREVDFIPRKFTHFSDVAKEIADSRFFGGIHIPHDNQVGLEKGAEISKNILELDWKN